MQLLGAEGCAVNAVLADPSATHHYGVSRHGLFLPCRPAVYLVGHDTACAAEHQGLAEVAFIEQDGAVDSGDATLVAAVLNSLPDPFEYSLGMQEPLWQGLVIVRRAEAEHVGIEYEPGAKPCPKRVPVDAHDACKCAAVRVQG